MPPAGRQSAAEGTSLARYGVRAVDTGNETQKTHGEAMYTALTFRRLRSSSSQRLPMCGVEGEVPSSFSRGI